MLRTAFRFANMNYKQRQTKAMTDTSTKAKTQQAAILNHLQKHGSIDMPTAWKLYGCAALRSRISDLRNKHGIEIETRMQTFISRFGHHGSYAVYHLKDFEKKLNKNKILNDERNN